MKDPDSVEVDEEMEEGATLVVRLEEGFVPFDFVELHESLSGWNVDETRLFAKDRVSNERGHD